VPIAIALANDHEGAWLLQWIGVDVIYRTIAGVGIGALLGYALGRLVFRLPNRSKLSRAGDGFVALGITILVYGFAEAAHGYGFVSVFVAGLALRAAERNHKYHQTLHDFSEQLERLLMTVSLVLFGGALTSGRILNSLTRSSTVYALLAIFLIRPLAGWITLAGLACPTTERAVISVFGIRGLGTIYYLAYAMQKPNFEKPDIVWSTAAITILISIVLHGVTVTPIMRLIDRRQRSGAAAEESKKLRAH
jgi:sodium/hydrogen antiporter